MSFNKYMEDIERYLKAKLPDVPEATLMEIGTHIAYKTVILVTDLNTERYRYEQRRASKAYSSMRELRGPRKSEEDENVGKV